MSHEIIIIHRLQALADDEATTAPERKCLQEIIERVRTNHRCSARDAQRAATIWRRPFVSDE